MKLHFFIAILFFGFFSNAQESFYTFDATEILSPMVKEWSVGNGIDEPYFEVEVYGDMDFQYHTLEIMNSKIIVYGDTLNSALIIKRFFSISELEVRNSTLSTQEDVLPSLSMFPNPATTNVTFKGDYIEKILIYNISGQIVFRKDVESNIYRFNCQNLSSGTYIVRVWLNNNRGIFKKLIIK